MGLRYRSEMDADPHKPLRDDVRLLGELLGETVKRFAGEDVFDVVERARALAKSGRAGNERAFSELAGVLAGIAFELQQGRFSRAGDDSQLLATLAIDCGRGGCS